MSLVGYVHKDGGTTSTTGGTSATLASLGGSRNNHEFYVAEDSSTARRRVKTRVSDPKVQAELPGGWSPRRSEVKVLQPITLADGTVYYNTLTISAVVHVETTDAQGVALTDHGAQLCNSANIQGLVMIGTPG